MTIDPAIFNAAGMLEGHMQVVVVHRGVVPVADLAHQVNEVTVTPEGVTWQVTVSAAHQNQASASGSMSGPSAIRWAPSLGSTAGAPSASA